MFSISLILSGVPVQGRRETNGLADSCSIATKKNESFQAEDAPVRRTLKSASDVLASVVSQG